MSRIRWIHFSDLHLNLTGTETKRLRENLLEYLDTIVGKIDYAFFTGDIRHAPSGDFPFEIYLADGRILVTYIGDVYVLTAADVREIVSEYEVVDCIVVVSNWDEYTSEAKEIAKTMGIGVFKLKEFMKAINYNGKKFLDTYIEKTIE